MDQIVEPNSKLFHRNPMDQRIITPSEFSRHQFDRRDFLKTAALAGGGLALGSRLIAPPVAQAQCGSTCSGDPDYSALNNWCDYWSNYGGTNTFEVVDHPFAQQAANFFNAVLADQETTALDHTYAQQCYTFAQNNFPPCPNPVPPYCTAYYFRDYQGMAAALVGTNIPHPAGPPTLLPIPSSDQQQQLYSDLNGYLGMTVPFDIFDLDPRFLTDPLNAPSVPLVTEPLVYFIEEGGYPPCCDYPSSSPSPLMPYGDPTGVPSLWAWTTFNEMLYYTDRVPFCYRLRRDLRITQLTLYVIVGARFLCYVIPACAASPIALALTFASIVWAAKVAAIKLMLHKICGDPL